MQVSTLKNNRTSLLFTTIRKRFLCFILLLVGFSANSFAQPANDDPCNAIPLVPDLVCNYQIFTNAQATASVGVPAPGCANYQGGDVWFEVVVPAASNGTLKFDTQAGVITDLGMAVYRGTCGNLQLIACDDDGGAGLMSQITLNSLTIGATLWVRVWEYGNDNNGTFGICVKYPGPPPAYDEPCNAVALPNATTTCNYTTFTTEAATASVGVPAPGCANYQFGDVWFTAVVPAGGIIKVDTQTGEMTDGGMAIYSGPCTNLTLIACDDNSSPNGNMPQIVASGLTPGSTIWIRMWSAGSTSTNIGSFGICVSIPPPAPANDNPCEAIALTATTTCNYVTYTTASATGTTGVPAPGCANYQGGDVWFTVVVPCDGRLIIDTQTGVMTDGGMAAYRGTCGNLQLIQCDDDGSPNGLMPQLSLSSLTPGSTIYLRVWEYGNDNPGTFGICVSIPPPPSQGASCFGGQPFCSSNTYTYQNSTNVPSLGSQGIYGCLFTTPNPAWYYMQLQTAGSLDIFIQQVNTAGTPIDVDFVLWGPFPTLAASCNNLSASNIVDCSYSAAPTETANIVNGQAGDFYILLITNYANQAGTVTFNQSGGTGSTNCDIVCTLTSGNSGPICPGQTVDLTALSLAGATYQWNGPNCFNQSPLSTQQNPTGVPVPSAPGQYIFWVTASFPGGSSCTSYDTVTVLSPPVIGNDTSLIICAGSTTDLTALPYNITGLTTSAWFTYPAGVPVANAAAVGIAGIYQLVGANVAGCTDTALVTLVIDTVRSTVTSTGNATCTVPGVITVTNPSGVGSVFEYSIDSNPGVFQLSNTFSPVPGTYVVTTKDSLGCTTSSSVVIDFTNDLTLSVRSDTTICLGQSVVLTANSSATNYSWTPTAGLSAPTSQTTIATPTDSTTYTVTATLGSCVQTASLKITVDKNLFVDAGGPLFVDAGGSVQAAAVVTGPNSVISNILWTPAAGLNSASILNPVVSPVINSGVANYQITVTNTSGCTATDDLIVNVLANCRNVRNAFTPNGDGNNDFWLVYDDYSCLQNVTVHVFNRYGSKIFESKDYRNTWDGRFKGKSVPDGTYYAVVEFKLLTGRTITVKSDLTILR